MFDGLQRVESASALEREGIAFPLRWHPVHDSFP